MERQRERGERGERERRERRERERRGWGGTGGGKREEGRRGEREGSRAVSHGDWRRSAGAEAHAGTKLLYWRRIVLGPNLCGTKHSVLERYKTIGTWDGGGGGVWGGRRCRI
eukprot:1093057-Rhodomonas_salina.1